MKSDKTIIPQLRCSRWLRTLNSGNGSITPVIKLVMIITLSLVHISGSRHSECSGISLIDINKLS
jgi:hypothetical protein